VSEVDYVIRVLNSPLEVPANVWDGLLMHQSQATPFMHHAYLAAMQASGSATPQTGWTPRFFTLWKQGAGGLDLHAACALYLKNHSYGEYVFDHAWANAYHQHGLSYYPKALIAPPFTPVPGTRLLATDDAARLALVKALVHWCGEEKLSSLHVLFGSDADVTACEAAGLMLRHNVQFHWTNVAPTLGAARPSLPPEGVIFPRVGPAEKLVPALCTNEQSVTDRPFADFDDFLMSLSQDKRKKIRQERRKVVDAGVTFRWSLGQDISDPDWDFFYRCYERTYLEHGNAPYLSRDFFHRMASTMPENWLLFVGEREGRPIATSLIAVHADLTRAEGLFDHQNTPDNVLLPHPDPMRVAYGRYWGAMERVDCLHFEACYYQPLAWCIAHSYHRFEGGAQGEHKMARALLPVRTTSAHWLAHPSFADAVERFLAREGEGIDNYLDDLAQRNPFKALAP
jgi:predicted N-acyltransferase